MRFIQPTVDELGLATKAIQASGASKLFPYVPEAGGPDIPWSSGGTYSLDE